MNKAKTLLEKIGPELKTFTLTDIAELGGLVLSESHFRLSDDILSGFEKALSKEEGEHIEQFIHRRSYNWQGTTFLLRS